MVTEIRRAKIDRSGASLDCTQSGLICVDGAPLFRLVVREGAVWVLVRDQHRERSAIRGTDLVMIPLSVLVALLDEAAANEVARGLTATT
jgi:hypothetical protein